MKKKTNKEKYAESIKKMKELISEQNSKSCDIEANHGIADAILADFLRQLGYNDLIDLYDQVNKWYG